MIGQFRDRSDRLVNVTIGDPEDGVIIGGSGSTILFGDDPVVIEYSVDDSFEAVIRKQATINLVTKDYVGKDLFSGTARGVEVIVAYDEGDTIFSGYLSPTTFNQPYNTFWDEFSLEAIDYLCTLEYYKYNNTADLEEYEDNKADAGVVSFSSILTSILPSGANIIYDRSRGLTSSSLNTIFTDLSVSENLFYGEDFDDIWTQLDVLKEILQYLNLHIIQEGEDFYIFDWATIREPASRINTFLDTAIGDPNYIVYDINNFDLDKAVATHRHTMLQLPYLAAGDETYYYVLTLDINAGQTYDEDNQARYVGFWTENGSSSWLTNSSTPGEKFYSLYIPDQYCLYTLHGVNQKWDMTASTRIFNTQWYNLTTNQTVTPSSRLIYIRNVEFAGSNTSITVDSVYNQISLTCDIEDQETLINNPLDKDKLKSYYGGRQPYMNEYISEGNGDRATESLNAIVKGNNTDYEDCKVVKWFTQVMTNPDWKLYTPSGDLVDDLCEQDEDGVYINQWKIPKYLREHSCTPAILRMGNYEIKGGEVKDNSPINKIDMTDYLFISVNGNEDSGENTHYPSDSYLENAAPILEYRGNAGGIFSPPDDKTTNYIVFSGKILIQPIQYESSGIKEYGGPADMIPIGWADRNNNYQSIYSGTCPYRYDYHYPHVPDYNEEGGVYRGDNMIKSDNNEDGRFYTRKFFSQTYYKDKEPLSYLTVPSLQPWTKDKSAHGYQYNYSEFKDSSDKFSKVPILECELIIGNKRLIETEIDEYGNSTFEWVVVGEEPTDIVDGVTVRKTTFSLGVNPKIGDYIIGDEFDIQNTIDYTMNLETNGTAIPITREDALSGKMTFRILGLVNCCWDDILKRHKTWFRHTKWTSDAKFILAHAENIILKAFECKIYSDNGLYSGYNDDNEIVYKSAESDSFIEVKDDIEFKISTQLTSKQAMEMGVSNTVNLNAVLSSSDNLPIIYDDENETGGIYDARTNETDKPEKHYINQYYLEYSVPKTLLELDVHDKGSSIYDLYTWGKLGNTYSYYSRSLSVKRETSTIKLKEI